MLLRAGIMPLRPTTPKRRHKSARTLKVRSWEQAWTRVLIALTGVAPLGRCRSNCLGQARYAYGDPELGGAERSALRKYACSANT
eukprot:6208617-Pleurochrysis_carterae.AAC.2